MTLLEELAQLLNDRGHGTYNPDTVGGDVGLARMAPDPDEYIGVYLYAGPEADALHGYDEPRWQVRVRGPEDPRVSLARAQAIYDDLHGLPSDTVLPGGTPLETCIGQQSGPIYIGRDRNNRPEWTINFRLEVRNPTPHRA